MSEIILCNQSMSPKAFQSQCNISIDQISAYNCTKPSAVAANTPYLLASEPSALGQSLLSQLSPVSVSRELTSLSVSMGGDNVVALADMTAKLKEYNIGLMGASTSVYANRIGGFAGAVKNYQSALMEYRSAVTSSSALKTSAKQKAHVAFQKMQSQFRNELNVVTGQIKTRRRTPLTSVDRATNIARSSRSVASLNVTSQVQVNNLVTFSKYAKFLGNGLAVIDFGSRVGSIHNSYQADGNWEKQLFIESSSFLASVVTGTVAVNVGTAALGFLMVATPIGWVGLIVGGLAVAGTAAGTSMWVNGQVKANSGSWYDMIMKSLGS
jgi:hypothetical protein